MINWILYYLLLFFIFKRGKNKLVYCLSFCSLEYNLLFFFNFILFLNFTNCISFAKYQNESMCSPSWTHVPPPSLYHPSGSSQCTSPKYPVSCIEPGLADVVLKEHGKGWCFIRFCLLPLVSTRISHVGCYNSSLYWILKSLSCGFRM